MAKKMNMNDIIEKAVKGSASELRIFRELGDDKALKLYDRLCKSEKMVEVEGYNEPVKLYFSAEEGEPNWGTKFNIEVYNAMGKKLGNVNYFLDIILRMDTIELEDDIENRNAIGKILLNELVETAKEAGKGSIVNFNYQDGDKGLEDFYKEQGFFLTKDDVGQYGVVSGEIIKKENANEDETEADI